MKDESMLDKQFDINRVFKYFVFTYGFCILYTVYSIASDLMFQISH